MVICEKCIGLVKNSDLHSSEPFLIALALPQEGKTEANEQAIFCAHALSLKFSNAPTKTHLHSQIPF
jgi:hypothetical protein